MQCHVTSRHVTSRPIILLHSKPSHVKLRHVVTPNYFLLHVMPHHARISQCHATSCQSHRKKKRPHHAPPGNCVPHKVTSHHIKSHHIMSSQVTRPLAHVTSRHTTPFVSCKQRHVKLSHTSRQVTPYQVTSLNLKSHANPRHGPIRSWHFTSSHTPHKVNDTSTHPPMKSSPPVHP